MRTKDKYVSHIEFDKLKEEFKEFKETVKILFKTMKEQLSTKANKEKKIVKKQKSK